MASRQEEIKMSAYTIGFLLIILGIIFLLDKLNILKSIGINFDVTNFWPVLLIIFGIDLIYTYRKNK